MNTSRLAFAVIPCGLVTAATVHGAVPSSGMGGYLATRGLMKKAVSLFEEGKLKDAEGVLESCIERVPDHYEAHYLLAQLAYQNREYGAALDHIQTAIHSLEALGRAYDHQTQKNQQRILAIRDTIQVVVDELDTIAGGDPTCMSSSLAQYRQAIQNLDRQSASLNGNTTPFAVPASFYAIAGNCLLRLHRNAEAKAQYTKAIEADSRNVASWNNLAYLWFADHDVAKAMETLRKAESFGVKLNPSLDQAILKAAMETGGK